MESQWSSSGKYSQDSLHWAFSRRLTELQCEPEQFKGRVIFMSMYNDIVWGERRNTEKCIMNSDTVANYARRFLLGRWSFLGPGSEKKWYGTYSDKPDGDWDKTAGLMMLNFAESVHPIFRATCALERGGLRSKGKGKKSIHFNGSEETIELVLRTIISVNPLSIYEGVADLCIELSKDSEVAGKNLQRMKIWNQWKFLQNFLLLILTPTRSCRETCCKIMNINSSCFLKTRNCPNCAPT